MSDQPDVTTPPKANTNCLDGIACPACKSLEPFRIEVNALSTVYDDGTEHTTGHRWGGSSFIQCMSCQKAGTVHEFSTANQKRGK